MLFWECLGSQAERCDPANPVKVEAGAGQAEEGEEGSQEGAKGTKRGC